MDKQNFWRNSAMAARLDALDWAQCPVGSPSVWPPALRCTFQIMLAARQPISLWWGESLIFFCNDAYAARLPKHADAIGQPAAVVWATDWPQLGPCAASAKMRVMGADSPVLSVAASGGEVACVVCSLSPIPDDQGAVGGLLCLLLDRPARSDESARCASECSEDARPSHERERNAAVDKGSRAVEVEAAALSTDSPPATAAQLRAIIENTDAAIWSVDRECRLLVANAVCNNGTIAQIGRALAPGESVLPPSLPPDYIAFWQENYARVLAGEKLVLHTESWIQHRGGFLEIHLSPIVEHGAVVGVVGMSRDITARKQAEAALERSQSLYRLLAENSLDAVSLTDGEGSVMYTSPANSRRLGYTEQEFLQLDRLAVFELIHPDDRAMIVAEITRCEAVKAPSTVYTFRIRKKDGDYMWLEDRVRWEYDEQGRLIRSIINSREVTKRKQMEAALQASEERLRYALDAAEEGLWDWNVRTDELFVNDRWVMQYGYTPGEIKPEIHTWLSVVHPEDVGRVTQGMQEFASGLSNENRLEYRVVTRSGAVRWQLGFGRIVARDAHGQATRIVGANLDITERKEAEQQLRDSEERFRLVAQNSPNIISIRDESGALQYISPAVEQLIGRTPEDVLRNDGVLHAAATMQSADELTAAPLIALGVDAESAANWVQMASAVRYCAQHPGEKVRIASRQRAKTGALRDLETIYQGIARSTSGCEVLAVATDITEHKELARVLQHSNVHLEEVVAARTAELQATIAELHRANLSKDAFMATVSHELRTPLTSILGVTELLQIETYGALNARQLRAIQRMGESGAHLLALINDLLDLSKIDAAQSELKLELCDVNELCAASVALIRDMASQKRHRITLLISPAGMVLCADQRRLKQMLVNLLSNAIKFTPGEGAIELRVEGDLLAQTVVFVVTDNGIGISEANLAQLFQPFFQIDSGLARRYSGTGLGLALVKRMAELHGGTVTVTSEPGVGSTFTVTVPWRTDTAALTASHSPTT